ncbi:hypothetical protein OPV22_021429 [Ensete ventricosum]|uniref:Uncharacterized protein n=1 Tax=Ensete ventricosum TaxID=4639 RepID=A0AAV8QH37_ENSVE|nr:hypothetical protein OPV22_021429 [Ensete ventricosum]
MDDFTTANDETTYSKLPSVGEMCLFGRNQQIEKLRIASIPALDRSFSPAALISSSTAIVSLNPVPASPHRRIIFHFFLQSSTFCFINA